jgi:hypothetical protein
MLHKRKNPSAELSTDTRELIARLVGPLDKRGISRQVFRDCLAEADAPVSKASLDRWVHNYARSGRVFTPEKATGAAPLLDAEQRDVAAGWVWIENDEHRPVSVESFRRFCNASLGVGMSPSSARNYLTDLGFASKVAQTNAIGFSIDVDALVEMMCEWVEERRSDGDLDKLVASVDFTYTGHRPDRVSSYARVGGAQPKSNMPIAQYTNCIVTCVWSDGKNRTPPVLFTYNGKFRFNRGNRAAWQDEQRHLEECLAHFDIDRERVIYVGAEKKETRLYVPESSDLLRQFLELYEVPAGATVFSDNHQSTKGVLTVLGFAKHVFYPAPVHQYLSPNDNRLHGTAKKSWRASQVDFKDDVESSLLLLNHLDSDIEAHSEHWFRQNIMELTEESAREIISGRGGKGGGKVDAERRRAYRLFAGLDARGGQQEGSEELRDSLDGKT